MHGIVWSLALSDLDDYCDTALFEALCKLYMVLPQHPAAAACMTARASLMEHGVPTASLRNGGVAEATLALEASLLRTIALFLEGKWPSRFRDLVRISLQSPSVYLGSVILLAQAVPPPLPICIEKLPHSLVLLPPTAGPSVPVAATAMSSYVDQIGAAIKPSDGSRDSDASGKAPDASGKYPHTPPLTDWETTRKTLVDALSARRVRWRGLLSEAADDVREYFLKLSGCSCQRVSFVLASLLVRICDVLGGVGASQVVVQPLLRLQDELGRCASDESIDLPANLRGSPAVALSRVTLLLTAIAAHPSGRLCLLAVDGSLLLGGLLPTLQPGTVKGACRRAGLLLLQYLCDPRVSLSTPGIPPEGVEWSSLMLPLSVLIPAIAAVDDLVADHASGCSQQVLLHGASAVLSCMASTVLPGPSLGGVCPLRCVSPSLARSSLPAGSLKPPLTVLTGCRA